MCLSEHPFGTVKWYRGAHYLLCKGKTKAAAELGLSFLAYNLTRAINIVGVRSLIAAMWAENAHFFHVKQHTGKQKCPKTRTKNEFSDKLCQSTPKRYKTELSTPKRYAPNGSIDRNWATYFISENTYAWWIHEKSSSSISSAVPMTMWVVHLPGYGSVFTATRSESNG